MSDAEVEGLMVVCNRQSKSYCVPGDLWRHKRFLKAIRAAIGRAHRVTPRDARIRARELMAAIARGEKSKRAARKPEGEATQ